MSININRCLDKFNNRFKLVLYVSRRARKLSLQNSEPLVDCGNSKFTVIALNEVSMGHVVNDNDIIDDVDI